VDRVVPTGFQDEDDSFAVWIPAIGELSMQGGSQYAQSSLGAVVGSPSVDLDAEHRMMEFMREAADRQLIKSMHDISSGGILIAIAESCLEGGVGCQVIESDGVRSSPRLFDEVRGVLTSTDPGKVNRLSELARGLGIGVLLDGDVRGAELRVQDHKASALSISLDELREAYESGLPRALGAATLNV
jgi:phosphoribosylformylglycinamidine synthase